MHSIPIAFASQRPVTIRTIFALFNGDEQGSAACFGHLTVDVNLGVLEQPARHFLVIVFDGDYEW